MENVSSILKGHIFFKGIKKEYFKLILELAREVEFKAGDVIFKEGGPADYFYLIKKGLVAIEVMAGTNQPVTIQTIQAGDILGWSWLISPYRSRFNCRAAQDTQLIAFDGKRLREKCEANPDFGYELLKRLAEVFTQRLEATRLQLVNVYDNEAKDKK